MIPAMTVDGLLPPGIHPAQWAEVVGTFGHNSRRRVLLGGLRDACRALASANCSTVWLDGSFVTDKELPGDYDACWDWQAVDLSLLDPCLLDYSPSGRAIIKAKYLGDVLMAGVETGSGLTFVEFFQRTRDGDRKGIVSLDPRRVP